MCVGLLPHFHFPNYLHSVSFLSPLPPRSRKQGKRRRTRNLSPLDFPEMGGKGDCPSPSSLPTSPVCCMCGDRGLAEELFRCTTCHVRLQHRYCSNFYPKAETYRACNWCLRDGGGKSTAREYSADQNNSMSSSSNSNGGSGTAVKSQRCSSALHLDKSIKKQRLPQKTSEARSQAKQAIRGKVRRYKLLEEVSS